VRYRGLAKNAAQVMVLIGLANLYAFAPEVGDGRDIRIASAARKWPTVAPKHRAHRLIEPVNPMPAPKKCHSGISKRRNAT